MRYLVISDVHLRWRIVSSIIKKEKNKYDKILFLGDYMDDFGAIAQDYIDMCKWLKDNIYDENKIFLLGNHDIAYFSHYMMSLAERHNYLCSGYSDQWYNIVKDYLSYEDWEQFKLHYFIKDNVLCTHAGLTNKLYDFSKIKNIKEFVETESAKALKRIKDNLIPDVFVGAGKSRGGRYDFGGIVWSDYLDDFEHVNGLNQIFGHTIILEPDYIIYDSDNTFDLALDTNNRNYAIYDDETNNIIIKKFDFWN